MSSVSDQITRKSPRFAMVLSCPEVDHHIAYGEIHKHSRKLEAVLSGRLSR